MGEFGEKIDSMDYYSPRLLGHYVFVSFKSWIDEARKEFPYELDEIKEPIVFDTEYISWDMTELYKWFVKWFGASE